MRSLRRTKHVGASGPSNYNAESNSAEAVAELTPDVLEFDLIGGAIIEEQQELISLENAFCMLDKLEDAADKLSEAGVDQEVIDNNLAPSVVTVMELVDEQTAAEVATSLEADDSKGFWKKVKETAVRIWEAIKKSLNRIIDFLISLVKRPDSYEGLVETVNKLNATLSDKVLNPVTINLRNQWSIQDKPVKAEGIVNSVVNISKFLDVGEEFSFAMLKDARDVIKSYRFAMVATVELSADRIDKIAEAEKRVNFDTKEAIVERYKKLRFTEMVGLSATDTGFVTSESPGDSKITTATREQCHDILHAIGRYAKAANTADFGKRLANDLKTFQKEISDIEAYTEKASALDKDLIARLRALPAKMNTVFQTIQVWFIGNDIRACRNALDFVAQSIKLGAPPKPAKPAVKK